MQTTNETKHRRSKKNGKESERKRHTKLCRRESPTLRLPLPAKEEGKRRKETHRQAKRFPRTDDHGDRRNTAMLTGAKTSSKANREETHPRFM